MLPEQMPAQLDRYDISDLLANLVERSMVTLDPEAGRYHMTESMRAYAMEHLSHQDATARERHFRHFVSIAERIAEQFGSGGETAAHQEFVLHEDNFRSAFEWSFDNDPNGCLHLMACLIWPWNMRSPKEAIRNALEILEAAPGADVEDQVWLRIGVAYVSMRRSEITLVPDLVKRALQDLETIDIPRAKTMALLAISWWHREEGDRDRAKALIGEAIELARANGLQRLEAASYTNLGELARQNGEFEEAARCYHEALAKCDSKLRSAMNLYNLGQVSLEQEDAETAERYYREALEWLTGAGIIPMVTAILGSLGSVHMLRGRYREGGLVMGWTHSWASTRGAMMDMTDRQLLERMHAIGEQRGGDEFKAAFQEGPRLTYEQVAELTSTQPS